MYSMYIYPSISYHIAHGTRESTHGFRGLSQWTQGVVPYAIQPFGTLHLDVEVLNLVLSISVVASATSQPAQQTADARAQRATRAQPMGSAHGLTHVHVG